MPKATATRRNEDIPREPPAARSRDHTTRARWPNLLAIEAFNLYPFLKAQSFRSKRASPSGEGRRIVLVIPNRAGKAQYYAGMVRVLHRGVRSSRDAYATGIWLRHASPGWRLT
jgi:hypothetical protein